MNKNDRQLWGLELIFEIIRVPSDFIAAVKRHKLSREQLSVAEIKSAYGRRAWLLKHLEKGERPRWEELLAPIVEIHASIYRQGNLALHEIFELKQFVWHYLALSEYCQKQGAQLYDLPDLGKLFELLDPEGNRIPSFRLSGAYSMVLADLDGKRQQFSLQLKEARHRLLNKAKEELGIPGLKAEFVLARHESEIIGKINGSSYFALQRESIANLSFVLADSEFTLDLKKQIAELGKAIKSEEAKILRRLSDEIRSFCPSLEKAIKGVKELGWDYACADFALRYDCCIPEIGKEIRLKVLRNLPLQLALEAENRSYQALDIDFSLGTNLITGPNMGGKTSILKSLAQCAGLLQKGIPLPAKSATMPIFDFIFYNHASETDNLSSFGAEVVAFSTALQKPGKGLFLLDEFAKGTNPREGEALATAVIGYLAESPHTCVAATHFSAPTRLQNVRQYQIKGIDSSFADRLSVDLKANLKALASAMDYSLIPLKHGRKPPLNALRIATILGMPQEILNRSDRE